MGGAEGTKLDLDFMDMEKVILFLVAMLQCTAMAKQYGNSFCFGYFTENRCNRRTGGRTTSENKRISAAKSNGPCQNGGCERNLKTIRTSEKQHVSTAGRSIGRLHVVVWQEIGRK